MSETHVRKSLADFAAKFGPAATLLAKVESVDEDEATCVLIDDEGLKFFDVRLRAVINGKESTTIYPKPGAFVLAVRIEGAEDWMVLWADELTKYRAKIGQTIFEQDESKLELSNNVTSLKSLLNDIVDEMLAIYAPKNVAAITAIKTKIPQLFK